MTTANGVFLSFLMQTQAEIFSIVGFVFCSDPVPQDQVKLEAVEETGVNYNE